MKSNYGMSVLSWNVDLGADSIQRCHFTSKINPIVETALWLSYLHNGISYTGKMTSLYWISPLCPTLVIVMSYLMPYRWLSKNYGNSLANALELSLSCAQQFDGLMQERCYSIANALDIHLSCINLSNWCYDKPCYKKVWLYWERSPLLSL